jgi:hypothetical protein
MQYIKKEESSAVVKEDDEDEITEVKKNHQLLLLWVMLTTVKHQFRCNKKIKGYSYRSRRNNSTYWCLYC